MRYLIDGYNLMYAGGVLGKKLGPNGFRSVRNRFLNDLSDALGPIDAPVTTVVFDAASAPDGIPRQTSHKGLSVVFAIENESADERIEEMIAAHSSPKLLTVVSSDRRIRQAATRRKSRAVTADEFWVELDARKTRRSREVSAPLPKARPLDHPINAEESAYWLQEFADLDQSPETHQALNNESAFLTDEEIAELEREIEREND